MYSSILNYILRIKDFQKYFLEINEGYYIVNLIYFNSAALFDSYLLDFLQGGKLRYAKGGINS